jgi:hypothetical protein
MKTLMLVVGLLSLVSEASSMQVCRELCNSRGECFLRCSDMPPTRPIRPDELPPRYPSTPDACSVCPPHNIACLYYFQGDRSMRNCCHRC